MIVDEAAAVGAVGGTAETPLKVTPPGAAADGNESEIKDGPSAIGGAIKADKSVSAPCYGGCGQKAEGCDHTMTGLPRRTAYRLRAANSVENNEDFPYKCQTPIAGREKITQQDKEEAQSPCNREGVCRAARYRRRGRSMSSAILWTSMTSCFPFFRCSSLVTQRCQ